MMMVVMKSLGTMAFSVQNQYSTQGLFVGKIDHIHADLDSLLIMQNLDIQRVLSGSVSFLLISPEGVDRSIGKVRPTANKLDSCPDGLVK